MPAMPNVPKRFNIAGPCDPARHYMLPPLERLPEVRKLVTDGDYFVIHAARQSGKTTFLRALASAVNAEGKFYALYCSLETLRNLEDDEKAMARAIEEIVLSCKDSGISKLTSFNPDTGNRTAGTVVKVLLNDLCRVLDKPLILFFDEADCLSGQPLITFLGQLRSGFISRSSSPFPWSLALVGMRNIRDYKAQVRPDSETLGSASPFNIITEAMTLANFTPADIRHLYQQHTDATGQAFEPEALERVAYWTEGQPWLVNAIARKVVEEDLKGDHTQPVKAAHIETAADVLMKRRNTHLESLLARLREPRVRKVLDPLFCGGRGSVNLMDDDTQYCIDLGLVVADGTGPVENPTGLRPANPLYRDALVRALNAETQAALPAELVNRWFVDGCIDMTGLLKAFQTFWRENSEIWVERYEYRESAPHLILQAFLQRVVNGGAHIEREFALGRGRVDLCVEYGVQKYPIELKLAAGPKARAEGLEQTAEYMDRCGATEGWLVIFDRNPKKSWNEKITWSTESGPGGKIIHVVGC